MTYNRMITIQKLVDSQWFPEIAMHAAVNKASGGEELEAGAFQAHETLQFDVRYCSTVADIRHNTQLYQIVYRGNAYKITDYDDFKEQHRNIRLRGIRYD